MSLRVLGLQANRAKDGPRPGQSLLVAKLTNRLNSPKAFCPSPPPPSPEPAPPPISLFPRDNREGNIKGLPAEEGEKSPAAIGDVIVRSLLLLWEKDWLGG